MGAIMNFQNELTYIKSIISKSPGSAFNHSSECFERYVTMQANAADREGFKSIAREMRAFKYDTFEGSLYLNDKLLRDNYSKGHSTIKSIADLKATLRHGEHAWPGGYQMYFITRDGGALSFETVRDEFCNCIWDMSHDMDSGWHVVACEINYEDADLVCDHTGKSIPSAYC